MPTVYLSPDPINSTQLIPGGVIPASGGKLFQYLAGSSTKTDTYTDITGLVKWSNPIVLDSGGNLGGSNEVWIPAGVTVKFVLAPFNDTDPPIAPYKTWDSMSGINDATSILTEWIPGPAPTFVSATSFTLVGDQTANFTPGRRVKTTNTVGTRYGTISTSVFGAVTTVTITNDSGTLDSGLSAVWYALINPVNTSLPLIVSVLNFGAKGDGVTDDTAAFNAARAAALAAKSALRISGTLLISSALTISTKEHWIFDGAIGVSDGDNPGSYLIKASTLNAALVTITGNGTIIEGGGIVGQVGNGGDGYVINAVGVKLVDPFVTHMGQDGIRVGKDAGANSNIFTLDHPVCCANIRHGIKVHDLSDANAGTLIQPFMQSNGGNGLEWGTSGCNTCVGGLSEFNTGFGVHFSTGAIGNVHTGGDWQELNNGTGSQIGFDAGSKWNTMIGSAITNTAHLPASATWTDSGTGNLVIGLAIGRGFSKNGTFTRDISAATSQQVITGVGFTPSAVRFFGAIDGTTNALIRGIDDGVTRECVTFMSGAGAYAVDANNSVSGRIDNANFSRGIILTFDADGFTIIWTKTGAPTGILTVFYEAIR